jgi:protein AaeX
MIAEVSLFGVFFSGALVAACLAGVALLVVRRLLLWLDFYRLVWHRHLVDLALFIILWAAAAMVMPALAGTVGRVW